jgi:hypothetical protein
MARLSNPSPGIAHAEQLQVVQEDVDDSLRLRHDANRPEAPLKFRFQIAWPGSVSSRRLEGLRTRASSSTARVLSLNNFQLPCRSRDRNRWSRRHNGSARHRRNCSRADTHCRRPKAVPCLQRCNQGGRNRREPGGHQADAGALRSLQGHQRVLQRLDGRRVPRRPYWNSLRCARRSAAIG